MQVVSWPDFQLPGTVNTLHVIHKLETSDETAKAPSVRDVTVSGATQRFQQSSWVDGHMLFAVKALDRFEASLVLDLNEDDDVIDAISFSFEAREPVAYRECYSGEALKVCMLLHRALTCAFTLPAAATTPAEVSSSVSGARD